MDPTSLPALANSVTDFLNLSITKIKVLKDVQDLEKESFDVTFTNINTSLLFTRDILEREDIAAETPSFEGSPIRLLEKSLGQLQSDLEKFCADIQESTSKRQLFRLKFRKHSLPKQSLERIQRSSDQLRDLLLQLDSAHGATIKDLNLDSPAKKEAKGHDIIFRKRPIRVSALDFSLQQNQLFQQAQKGSGDWLLQSQAFQDWLKDPGMILCLNGIPGSGKSVLSSLVVDHLKKRESESHSSIGIAFLFLDRRQSSEQRLPYLIGSLIQQLRRKNAVSQIRTTGSNKAKTPRKESFDTQELSRLLQESIELSSHTYVIVDALDECSDKESTRTLLCEALRRISPRTHILVTTRPTVQSTRLFPDALQLEVSPGDTILKQFVRSLMEAIKLSGSERDVVIENILERSQGNFLAALLVCNHVRDLSGQASPDALPARLRQATQEQTKDISRLGVSMMSQMRKDAPSMKSIQWVLFSRRPLHSPELRVSIPLLASQSDKKISLKQVQAFRTGLLKKDPATDMVQLGHASLREFLMLAMDDYCSDPHSEIAVVCVDYLRMHLTSENIKIFPESSSASSAFPNHPFLEYAASNWAYHVQRAHSMNIGKLTSLLSSRTVSSELSKFIGDRGQSKATVVKETMSGIHIAAHFGLVDVLKIFVGDRVAEINEKSSAGRTPLHVASAVGRNQVVAFLLTQGAGILDMTEAEGWTALHIAARKGHLSVAKQLLDFRNSSSQKVSQGMALLHYQDKAKRTPLHLAASAGHASVVSYLIERGSEINDIDSMGSSPLHHAIRSDQSEIVRILIDSGADVRTKDFVYRQTVTDLAWNRGDRDHGMSIKWSSYEVDEQLSKEVVEGGQATCRVLKRKEQGRQDSKHAVVFQKTFDLTKDESGNTQKYLLSEHKLLKRLNHPNIVSYLDYEEHQDRNSFSLYMEYCEGGDLYRNHRIPSALRDMVDDFGFYQTQAVRPESPQSHVSLTSPLQETVVWVVICQLSLAMAYLHHGLNFCSDGQEACFEKQWEYVIHRDLKPANVILRSDGSDKIIAKLCDLGIARERGVGVSAPKTKIGSAGYCPPEFPKWTIKADIWAFGQTIADTYKVAENESDHTPLQALIQACTKRRGIERPSSIQILEKCHDHFLKVDRSKQNLPEQTFYHLQATHKLLGQGVSYLLQAFRHVSGFLDDYSAFDSAAQKRRKAIIHRLQLFFEDGVEKLFQENPDENAKHLTVLLNFTLKQPGKIAHLDHLCKSQSNVNYRWKKSGLTALHLAVQQGDRKMVELLLRHGADKAIRDIHSQTAEDYATPDGPEGIDKLLKKGAAASSNGLSEGKEGQTGMVERPARSTDQEEKASRKVTFAE